MNVKNGRVPSGLFLALLLFLPWSGYLLRSLYLLIPLFAETLLMFTSDIRAKKNFLRTLLFIFPLTAAMSFVLPESEMTILNVLGYALPFTAAYFIAGAFLTRAALFFFEYTRKISGKKGKNTFNAFGVSAILLTVLNIFFQSRRLLVLPRTAAAILTAVSEAALCIVLFILLKKRTAFPDDNGNADNKGV